MSRRVPPETVEIYKSGQSIKSGAKEVWPFARAQQAFAEKRGTFRDKRRKFILFSDPDPAPTMDDDVSVSPCSLGVGDMEALAGAREMTCRQRERLIGHFDGSIH